MSDSDELETLIIEPSAHKVEDDAVVPVYKSCLYQSVHLMETTFGSEACFRASVD